MSSSLSSSLSSIIKAEKIPVFHKHWNDKDFNEFYLSHKSEIIGIVLSGSAADPRDEDSPLVPEYIFRADIPILGICYGFEYILSEFGGELEKMEAEERIASLVKLRKSVLFKGLDLSQEYPVEMSHVLRAVSLPKNFKVIATSEEDPIAAFEFKKVFGIQFHPEKNWLGPVIFKNFYEFCK